MSWNENIFRIYLNYISGVLSKVKSLEAITKDVNPSVIALNEINLRSKN